MTKQLRRYIDFSKRVLEHLSFYRISRSDIYILAVLFSLLPSSIPATIVALTAKMSPLSKWIFLLFFSGFFCLYDNTFLFLPKQRTSSRKRVEGGLCKDTLIRANTKVSSNRQLGLAFRDIKTIKRVTLYIEIPLAFGMALLISCLSFEITPPFFSFFS